MSSMWGSAAEENAAEETADQWRAETLAVTIGRPGQPGLPLNHPITTASNFRHGADETERDYSRADGTETTAALERTVAALETSGRWTAEPGTPDTNAVAYASGMAAISAVFDLLPSPARIVAPADCYQGVAAVLDHGEARRGWTVERLPTGDTGRWLAAMERAEHKPDLVWVESPSNPLLTVADVPAICAAGLRNGVMVAADNTFATPLLQKPIAHGASFSVHSATKFMGGHSDLLAGVVVAADPELAGQLRGRRALTGSTIGALEAFLTLRGLRTLPVRLARSQASAVELAQRLADSPRTTAVHYPGLPADSGHTVARRTMLGPGAVLSFETGASGEATDHGLNQLKVIVAATSLGGVESTAERRSRLVGQEAIPESLVRLSVGCEHVEDIWADLSNLLDAVHR